MEKSGKHEQNNRTHSGAFTSPQSVTVPGAELQTAAAPAAVADSFLQSFPPHILDGLLHPAPLCVPVLKVTPQLVHLLQSGVQAPLQLLPWWVQCLQGLGQKIFRLV